MGDLQLEISDLRKKLARAADFAKEIRSHSAFCNGVGCERDQNYHDLSCILRRAEELNKALIA